MKVLKKRDFTNGTVYALETRGYPIEVTDTFLPFYTKNAIGSKQNMLVDCDVADRTERWMVGVSCMSGCPVGCKFCATAKLKRFTNLTADEIVAQVLFVVDQNPDFNPADAKEFKINYTRMGEPFMNIDAVRGAIEQINKLFPNVHHYLSTIGLRNSDLSWIKDNITLQISLHSLDETKRDWLIPHKHKMSIEELGRIRTESKLKTTINMTLVDETDWDVDVLAANFDPEYFFVKVSPINENEVSDKNGLGAGVIQGINLA